MRLTWKGDWESLHRCSEELASLQSKDGHYEFCRYQCCEDPEIIVFCRTPGTIPYCCNCGLKFGERAPSAYSVRQLQEQPGVICNCCNIRWFPIGHLPLKQRPWGTVQQARDSIAEEVCRLEAELQILSIEVALGTH